MTVEYIDIVIAMKRISQDGKEIDHAVITEENKEWFMENMVMAEDMEGAQSKHNNEDSIGTINQFDVKVGDEHKLVAEDGTEYEVNG